MKKNFSTTLLIIFGGLLLLSCNKDWTCQCVPDSTNVSDGVLHIAINDKSKGEAVAACNQYDEPDLDCEIR